MSLGVLNNINAVYAENNLNNTSNSLSKVLNQLSSGSKINSGADDAAGLSLVDGLQANSMALTQSQTNATEGVGLLTVADGALSQVTNLLNRAVTLATEASNGTLNSSQDTAANQEYQSILSEVSNIGSTTTYNDASVFNTKTNIYTGDSSATGSSIDNLNIASLSSSNLGDTGGVMAYSNGANNVFVNLSGTSNAQATDQLNSSGTTTIDVSYVVKGANGTDTPSSTAISVGTGTNYGNTANGMISAINNAGLGLTASFTTQTTAGVQGGGSQTGIEIAGGQVAAGAAASSVSTSGILNPTGIPSSELLTQGQTFTFSQGGTQVGTTVTVGSTNDTLATLASAIGTATGNKVTATVITNGDGSQSLALGNSNASEGALTVAAVGGAGSATPTFTSTNAAGTNSPAVASSITTAIITGVATQTAVAGSNTFTLAGSATLTAAANSAVELSAGTSITITNNLPGSNTAMTYTVGNGNNTATNIFTGSGQNSLANLITTINGQTSTTGVTASTLNNVGGVLTLTSGTSQTGDNITVSNATLTNATNTVGLYSPTDGGAATTGSLTTTELNTGTGSAQDNIVSGSIVLSNGTALDNLTLTGNGTSTTYADMISTINANTATLGVTASWSTTMGSGTDHGILLTSTAPSGAATITTTGNTLADVTTQTGAITPVTSLYAGAGAAVTDALNVGGVIDLTSNGNSLNFTAAAGQNWGDLATAINGQANLGLNATFSGNALLLTSTIPTVSTNVTVGTNNLGDATLSTAGTKTTSTYTADVGASLGADFVSGTSTFTNGTNSFIYTGNGTSTSFTDLATALSQSDLGVTASFSDVTHSMVLTSILNGAVGVTQTGTLADTSNAGNLSAGTVATGAVTPVAVDTTTHGGVLGVAGTPVQSLLAGSGSGSSLVGTAGAAASYATGVLQLSQASTTGESKIITDATDQMTGQITLQAGTAGALNALTFIQGSGQNTANTIYTGGTSVGTLVNAINAHSSTLGLSASFDSTQTGTGAIYLQANASGSLTGGIISSNSTLADTTYSATTLGTAGGNAGVGTNALTGVTGNAASITVGLATTGGAVNSSDVLLAGSNVVLTNGGVSDTFIIGANSTGSATPTHTFYTGANNDTIGDLATTITASSDNGLSATATTNGLVVTSTAAETGNVTLTSSTLKDTTLGSYGNVSLGTFGSESDTVSGNFHITDAANSGGSQTISTTAGETVSQLISAINGPTNAYADGVSATWQSSGNSGAGSIVLNSTTEGSTGSISALTTSISDTAPSVNLSYAASAAYSTGISGDATNKLYDTTAGQTSSAVAGIVANQKSASGIATISYSDGAGQSLSASDLSNQTDAQGALTALNSAITDVAAQDGYIGAQINTLNAVSQVLSTQQENVVSAQNAVQATDYASATSNMSKYEILSQTGISALAQANSMQQEVTKLLQ